MPKLSDSCRIVFATHRQAVKSRVFRLNAKKPLNIGDKVVFHFIKKLNASCWSSCPCYRLLLLRTSSAYAPCMFMHLRTHNLSYSLTCYIWRHCQKIKRRNAPADNRLHTTIYEFVEASAMRQDSQGSQCCMLHLNFPFVNKV